MNSAKLYSTVIGIVKGDIYGELKPEIVAQQFNTIQLAYFNHLIGSIKGYQPGRPIPPVHLESSQRVDLGLSPFLRTGTFPVAGGFGNLNQFGDFMYGPIAGGTSAISGNCEDPSELDARARTPMAWVTNSEWNDFTRSLIDYPDLENPIGRYARKNGADTNHYGFQVMPTQISYVEMQYFRRPKDIVFGGTFGSAGFVPDATAANNVDPEWNDLDMNDLIGRLLIALGMPLDDNAVKEYGNAKTEKNI